MQRHIAELIKLADLQKLDGDRFVASQEDLQRFTELVIQECAAQLDANRSAVYDPNLHHEYWNCGVKWAVAKLKDHFAARLKYIDCHTL